VAAVNDWSDPGAGLIPCADATKAGAGYPGPEKLDCLSWYTAGTLYHRGMMPGEHAVDGVARSYQPRGIVPQWLFSFQGSLQ